jgi:hypothetical protein
MATVEMRQAERDAVREVLQSGRHPLLRNSLERLPDYADDSVWRSTGKWTSDLLPYNSDGQFPASDDAEEDEDEDEEDDDEEDDDPRRFESRRFDPKKEDVDRARPPQESYPLLWQGIRLRGAATAATAPTPARDGTAAWPCTPLRAAPASAANTLAPARVPYLRGGLLAASAGASTTDHRDQSARNLLSDDGSGALFWSSRGQGRVGKKPQKLAREDADDEYDDEEQCLYNLDVYECRAIDGAAGEERLTFTLGGVAGTLVSSVSIRCYRADFQPGRPVYPASRAQVWLGSSLAQLAPASPWLPLFPSAGMQSLPVCAVAAAGPDGRGARVLQVRLRGRPQWQLEDLKFYVALAYVGASGWVLPPPGVKEQLLPPQARAAAEAACGPAVAPLPAPVRWASCEETRSYGLEQGSACKWMGAMVNRATREAAARGRGLRRAAPERVFWQGLPRRRKEEEEEGAAKGAGARAARAMRAARRGGWAMGLLRTAAAAHAAADASRHGGGAAASRGGRVGGGSSGGPVVLLDCRLSVARCWPGAREQQQQQQQARRGRRRPVDMRAAVPLSSLFVMPQAAAGGEEEEEEEEDGEGEAVVDADAAAAWRAAAA